MSITIERGLPLPKMKRKYPWEELQVSDSFFVDGVKESVFRTYASLTAKKLGITLTVRKEANGLRCWRIK